jgi:hypothetical protein
MDIRQTSSTRLRIREIYTSKDTNVGDKGDIHK